MDYWTFIGTASFVAQVIALGLLSVGYAFKRNRNFRPHGFAMAAALVLHIITVLTVMIPSFVGGFTSPGAIDFAQPLVIISLVHGVLGLTAAALGIWLVASWHFRTDLQTCFRNKKLMLPTLTLWFVALLLGIVMYVNFYGTRLFA
jgi:uncharacterized membrane protein YozB (DUF420 family)